MQTSGNDAETLLTTGRSGGIQRTECGPQLHGQAQSEAAAAPISQLPWTILFRSMRPLTAQHAWTDTA